MSDVAKVRIYYDRSTKDWAMMGIDSLERPIGEKLHFSSKAEAAEAADNVKNGKGGCYGMSAPLDYGRWGFASTPNG